MNTTPWSRLAAQTSFLVLFSSVSSCVIVDVLDEDVDVHDTRFEAAETFRHELAVENRFRLRLDGISGEIEVVADPQATQVIVEGTRTVGSDSPSDAERHLEDLSVRVETSATEIYVETRQPSATHGRNYIVDYRITVPVAFRSSLVNVNGRVSVTGTSGRVEVTNVNGDVVLRDVRADVHVNLVNGRVDAEVDPPLDGKVELANVNGTIQLSVPTDVSAELSATVTNGSITVTDLVLLNPTSTARSLRATLGAGEGTLELVTVNGSITVRGR